MGLHRRKAKGFRANQLIRDKCVIPSEVAFQMVSDIQTLARERRLIAFVEDSGLGGPPTLDRAAAVVTKAVMWAGEILVELDTLDTPHGQTVERLLGLGAMSVYFHIDIGQLSDDQPAILNRGTIRNFTIVSEADDYTLNEFELEILNKSAETK